MWDPSPCFPSLPPQTSEITGCAELDEKAWYKYILNRHDLVSSSLFSPFFFKVIIISPHTISCQNSGTVDKWLAMSQQEGAGFKPPKVDWGVSLSS